MRAPGRPGQPARRGCSRTAAGDPRLGAIGGSYGGGYQFVGAFEELRAPRQAGLRRARPRDHLELPRAARSRPSGVVRTEWAAALSAAAAAEQRPAAAASTRPSLEGAATGTWPDGVGPRHREPRRRSSARTARSGTSTHGRKLDIPVLFGQGTTDGLFPLEQGLTNWRTAITAKARKQQHLRRLQRRPRAARRSSRRASTSPPTRAARSSAGGDFRAPVDPVLRRAAQGPRPRLRGYGRIHLATPASHLHHRRLPRRHPHRRRSATVVSTTTAGVPLPYEIAAGPIRIAGHAVPHRRVTAARRSRTGRSTAWPSAPRPLDAHLVQNNVLPLREPTAGRRRAPPHRPAVGRRRRAGRASTSTCSSRRSATRSSAWARGRPALITLDGTVVHLPVVR